MNDYDPDDPHNLRPVIEDFLHKNVLSREERRKGYAFSKFEVLFCDQYENEWEGLRAAMTVRFVVNVAATLHTHASKWRRR